MSWVSPSSERRVRKVKRPVGDNARRRPGGKPLPRRTLRVRRALEGGFTLAELVIALAILGVTLTWLVSLRLEAVDKVTRAVREREVRRAAQELLEEKLAEFLSDELEEVAGDVPGHPGWTWEWVDPLAPENIIQEGEEFLLACTIRLTYPDPNDPQGQEKDYELTTWIMPTEDQLDFILEQNELLMEENQTPWGEGLGGTYGY